MSEKEWKKVKGIKETRKYDYLIEMKENIKEIKYLKLKWFNK